MLRNVACLPVQEDLADDALFLQTLNEGLTISTTANPVPTVVLPAKKVLGAFPAAVPSTTPAASAAYAHAGLPDSAAQGAVIALPAAAAAPTPGIFLAPAPAPFAPTAGPWFAPVPAPAAVPVSIPPASSMLEPTAAPSPSAAAAALPALLLRDVESAATGPGSAIQAFLDTASLLPGNVQQELSVTKLQKEG